MKAFTFGKRAARLYPIIVRSWRRGGLTGFSLVAATFLFAHAVSMLWAEQTPPSASESALKLSIVILEGDGAINNVKLRTNREVIVRVEDENHRPIAGAAVKAFLPNDGSSGTFLGGGQMFNGTSAENGQVKLSYRPNTVRGKFQIRLSASFKGQNVVKTLAQANILGSAGVAGGLSLAAKILIVVAVAGGAVAGAGVALSHGGSNAAPSSPTSSTITIGAGTGPVIIGPPH